jgi:hypothetical protein
MKAARGYGRGIVKRIVISLDDETFAEVSARAVSARTSFAEEARLLIIVGLETMAMGEVA